MAAPNVVTLRQGEAIANDVRLYVVPDVILLADDTSPATITLSAPTQTELHAITLAAGANTITLSAPAQSQSMAITLAAGANTITLSAPAQSQSVTITLAAGSNTITLSAPTVPAVNLTMPVDTNIITLTAPAQSQSVTITLAAGSNTITLSAPAQSQSMAITLSAGSNTITLSAPAQSQVVVITLDAGSNTITLSAPAQSESHAVTLAAGANTITLSAPSIPAVDLTMPVSTCTITLTAPAQSEVFSITLDAGSNTITLSAPAQSEVFAITLAAGSNTVTLSAPAQSQSAEVTIVATNNVVTVSAPAPNFAFDQFLQAGSNTLADITAPDATLLVGVQFYENRTAWSEELDHLVSTPDIGWVIHNATVVPNATTAPDGTLTADKFVEGTFTNNIGYINFDGQEFPDVAQAVYSIYLKAAEYDTITMDFYDQVSSFVVGTFTLTGSGTAVVLQADAAEYSVGITDVGDGWYRCWLSMRAETTIAFRNLGGDVYFHYDNYDGGGSAGVYAWGAQTNQDTTVSLPYLRTQGTAPLLSTVFTFAAPVISLEAPIAELVESGKLLAGQNTITLTAPPVSLIVETFLAANANIVTLTAPTVTLHLTIAASANVLVITAPIAIMDVVSLDRTITAVASQITIIAPAATVSYRTGILKARTVARITVLKAQTVVMGKTRTAHEAPIAVLKAQSALLMVSEPLSTKLGLVVSSSESVVG